MAVTREVLRITKETSVGVRQVTPPGSDIVYIRLDHDNAFPDRPEPIRWQIRGAEGNNRRMQTGSQQVRTRFSLDCALYYSQAKVLLPWACTPDAGPPEALPTCTVDHLIVLDGGSTTVRQGYLGCTVKNFGLSANNNGQGVVCRTKFDGAYLSVDNSLDGTSYPIPAVTSYPTDQPMVFQYLSGNLSLNGARTNFRNLSINYKNILDVLYDESSYPQAIRFRGRDINFSVDFRYKATTDRADFDAVTARSATIALIDGSANSLSWALNSKNFYMALKDSLPLGGSYYQTLTAENYYDTAVPGDAALTISP